MANPNESISTLVFPRNFSSTRRINHASDFNFRDRKGGGVWKGRMVDGLVVNRHSCASRLCNKLCRNWESFRF